MKKQSIDWERIIYLIEYLYILRTLKINNRETNQFKMEKRNEIDAPPKRYLDSK
jgi:hypothetical protein